MSVRVGSIRSWLPRSVRYANVVGVSGSRNDIERSLHCCRNDATIFCMKINKTLTAVAALIFLISTSAYCAQVAQVPEWEDPAVNSINRLPARTYTIPLADESDALADALIRILSEKQVFSEEKCAGIRSMYSPDTVAAAYEELFDGSGA